MGVGIAVSKPVIGRTVVVPIAVALSQGGVYIMPNLVALIAGHVEQKQARLDVTQGKTATRECRWDCVVQNSLYEKSKYP